MLSQTSINLIGKYNRPKFLSNQICPLEYSAQKRPTIWNWFNEIYYPEVRRRIWHPVFLLIDNTPGYFEVFQRENGGNSRAT